MIDSAARVIAAAIDLVWKRFRRILKIKKRDM